MDERNVGGVLTIVDGVLTIVDGVLTIVGAYINTVLAMIYQHYKFITYCNTLPITQNSPTKLCCLIDERCGEISGFSAVVVTDRV